MTLSDLTSIAIRMAKDKERNPLKYWRPTPVQEAVLRDNSNVVLFRGGNQVGKTWCGIREVHGRCTWNHPYKSTPKKPLTVWVIVHSWEQSKVIQSKFYELAPKDELHDDTEYITGKGFRGKYPIVKYKNGSIVYFKTTGQGTLGIASQSCDFVWIDEPPPPELWGEIKARTTRTRGQILLTLTPIGAPVDYLRDMVADGLISEHVGALTVENCTPLNCKPMLSEKEIEDLTRAYLSIDRDARIMGSWDGGIPEGRIFDSFDESMISNTEPIARTYDNSGNEREKEFMWSVGIDHGHDVASQVAILTCIDMTDPKDPWIYVVDEYVSGGGGANKHARGIIKMLARNGLTIADITRWTGDRKHGGNKKGDGRMSNAMLLSGFAHELDYGSGKLPFKIQTAFKPRWSVLYGCQVIHERMITGKFQIFTTCEMTIKSLKMWSRKSNGLLDTLSEHKHCIDALRYAVMPIVDVKYRSAVPNKLYKRW